MSPIVLGHRGGRGEGWPVENSHASFARALAEGADGIELDVRLSADGVPIVFHDATLARLTSDARPVQRVRAADLPVLAGGERIPRLDEVLESMRGHIVNIELKTDVKATSLLGDVPKRMRLVQAASRVVANASGVEVRFSSFDPLAILALRAAASKVPRALLLDHSLPSVATALPLSLRRVMAAAHLEDVLCTESRVARLARAGLSVAAWTVNDTDRARALVAMGVSWLITDAPGRIASAVRSHRA